MNDNKSKNQFLLGLFGGIAVVAIIGLIIMSVVLVNSKKNEPGTVAGEDNIVAAVDSGQPSAPITVEINDNDHVRGNPNANITLVEWSDFQCPFCARFNQTVNQVLADYPDQVRVVYRHFPLDSIHPYARLAAEASECAGDQGKFWEYHDQLYAQQNSIQSGGDRFLKETANSLGLDQGQFKQCLDSGKHKSLVQEQYQAGIKAGVRGTPGSFLNGQELGGALPYEALKARIDSLL